MTNADGSPQQQPTTPVERPRYGEYLPAGSPPPYQAPPAYQPDPSSPAFPVAQQPVAGGYPASPYYQAAPTVRTRKVADLVVTCVLLAIGFFGMLIGILATSGISESLANEYATHGLPYTAPAALPVVVTTIWISHVLLFLAAVGGSIPLLVKRRIAFWVPLVAGVVAAIVFWGGLIVLITSDPALMNALQSGR
ncbi:MAG TPA: DUF6264 family protein [Galbitalea sp.]|jgi:hypothetical protein